GPPSGAGPRDGDPAGRRPRHLHRRRGAAAVTRPLTVMLVAAEASGDDRGAGLAHALKRRLGAGVRFVGVGGERMAAEGVQSPFDISDISILGLLDGLLAYPKIVRRADETASLAVRERPDAAILIDSWGFTLRV